MLAVIACLAGIFALLVADELLGVYKILKGEYRRKFLHISAGTFIAFWPWLISWHWIEISAVLMIAFMVANRYIPLFNYHGWIGRARSGDIFFGLAIFVAAFIAHNKVFFALAILQVAVADGLAAVAGISSGKNWDYKVFGSKKTVIGSMIFWIASACIFGAGLLAAHDVFSFQDYYMMLLLLPPLLTLLENVSIFGLDNLVIPIATIVILRLVQA